MTSVASVGSGDSDNAESRAAAWVIRSSEGPLTAEDQQALDAWLASDTRNLGAWVKAQAAWLDVDRLVALDTGTANEPVRVTKPLPWRKMAIAASVLLAVGLGFVAEDRLPGRIETARGEVRRVALADGSTLFMNGDTLLQVRFSDGQRRIVLRRGEASFKVAHDAARPFVVEAGNVSARAVGTDFTVGRAADGDIAVTVAEGRVKVTDAARRANSCSIAMNSSSRQPSARAAPGSTRVRFSDNRHGAAANWSSAARCSRPRSRRSIATLPSRWSSTILRSAAPSSWAYSGSAIRAPSPTPPPPLSMAR